MSKENIIRVTNGPNGEAMQIMPDGSLRPMEDRTDWKRLYAMTEEEIEAGALSDPDNPPLTDEELARFHRVPNPKAIRQKLNMTQEQFSETFNLPIGTLRDWEQHLHEPDAASRSYLRVIARNPAAVIEALRS